MTSLGLDIGATNVRYGILEGENVVKRASTASRLESPEALAVQCKEIMAKFPEAEHVGLAMPGPLDRDGVLHSPPNFPRWDKVNFRQVLEKTLGRTFVLDRDSVAALVGEWKVGVAKAVQNVVLLTIGSGIGGAAVVDGKILRGHHGFSGEFGHAILGPAGRKCGLGHEGCVEAWAAGRALENGVSLGQATDVFARLLLSMELIFDPELIVLSGGMSDFDRYVSQATEKANNIGLQTTVKRAKSGEWAGVAGAALLATEQS